LPKSDKSLSAIKKGNEEGNKEGRLWSQEYELATQHAIPLQTQTRHHVDTIRILVAKNHITRLAPKELGWILLTQGTCTLS
jgi:hypothetical protein